MNSEIFLYYFSLFTIIIFDLFFYFSGICFIREGIRTEKKVDKVLIISAGIFTIIPAIALTLFLLTCAGGYNA